MQSSELPGPAMISTRIRAGELPSAVLRSTLVKWPQLQKHDLIPLLREAFQDTSSDVLHIVWHWRERDKQAAYDAQFDIHLLRSLLRVGVELPWDEAFCDLKSEEIETTLHALAEDELRAARESVSFETLSSQLRAVVGKVLCIQALWDGDSSGWHVMLEAVIDQDDERKTIWLGTVKFGGDIRLFNGDVPPWPEAVHAREVGVQLADAFGAEFYFPSPDQPEIDLPPWRPEQDLAGT